MKYVFRRMSGGVVDSQKEKNKTVKNVWIVRLCQTFHCWSAHVGAGATLLEGDLGLFVPAVDDELVMVHKSLEGVWQMWVTVYVEGKFVQDFLCYLLYTISFQAVFDGADRPFATSVAFGIIWTCVDMFYPHTPQQVGELVSE